MTKKKKMMMMMMISEDERFWAHLSKRCVMIARRQNKIVRMHNIFFTSLCKEKIDLGNSRNQWLVIYVGFNPGCLVDRHFY